MPEVAGFVDLCRNAFGRAFVDSQMATAQLFKREHEAVLASQGKQAADRFHKANEHRCTFFAEEGGRTVGMPSAFGNGPAFACTWQTQKHQPDPPIGTPVGMTRTGNSAPTLAPVAGRGNSPVISPVAGK
ncbi:MAG: hypothetical protein JWP93_282 [Polaromonas sp.]|nr:hypothetical protein [Polaromonas sp.]